MWQLTSQSMQPLCWQLTIQQRQPLCWQLIGRGLSKQDNGQHEEKPPLFCILKTSVNIILTSKLQKKCPICGQTLAEAFLRSTLAMPDAEQLFSLVKRTASRRSRWRAKSHQQALREKPPSTGIKVRGTFIYLFFSGIGYLQTNIHKLHQCSRLVQRRGSQTYFVYCPL